MTVEIRVPTLGELVTEATVAKWLKQPGERVERDEPVVELETDKVTLEVPAPQAGVIGEIQAAEGSNVPVGAVLGTIARRRGGPQPPLTPALSPQCGERERRRGRRLVPSPRAAGRGRGRAQAREGAGSDARTLRAGGAQARRRERGRCRAR